MTTVASRTFNQKVGAHLEQFFEGDHADPWAQIYIEEIMRLVQQFLRKKRELYRALAEIDAPARDVSADHELTEESRVIPLTTGGFGFRCGRYTPRGKVFYIGTDGQIHSLASPYPLQTQPERLTTYRADELRQLRDLLPA